MLVKTYGGAVYGVNAAIITIEVNIIQGASFYMVGLPDNAVKESQFRIESALSTPSPMIWDEAERRLYICILMLYKIKMPQNVKS